MGQGRARALYLHGNEPAVAVSSRRSCCRYTLRPKFSILIGDIATPETQDPMFFEVNRTNRCLLDIIEFRPRLDSLLSLGQCLARYPIG
jgi:hypothetical protein